MISCMPVVVVQHMIHSQRVPIGPFFLATISTFNAMNNDQSLTEPVPGFHKYWKTDTEKKFSRETPPSRGGSSRVAAVNPKKNAFLTQVLYSLIKKYINEKLWLLWTYKSECPSASECSRRWRHFRFYTSPNRSCLQLHMRAERVQAKLSGWEEDVGQTEGQKKILSP